VRKFDLSFAPRREDDYFTRPEQRPFREVLIVLKIHSCISELCDLLLCGSASEVLRQALRVLDREEAVLDEALLKKVKASMTDPRSSVSASTVFKRLRARHSRRLKARKRRS
jgi:Arc/MetJ-type ribon-helix-helix transcriptional regulator